MRRIAYDLDEILFRTYRFWKTLVMEDGYKPLPHKHFRIKTDPPMTDEVIMKYFGRTFLHYKEIEIADGAKEILQRQYVESGDPIYIISNRPVEYADATMKLINRLDVPYKLTLTTDSDQKWKYLKGYDYFVEDRRRTARIISATGIPVLMVNTEYNDLIFKTLPRSEQDRVLVELINRYGNDLITPISSLLEVVEYF